jgi:hypothetical protein
VLNDNGLGSLVTLQTPVSPSWQVKPYLQQRESVMDAIRAMVDQLGWWARFEWNAGLAKYELTLAQPDRASATVHKVLDQAEERECSALGLAVWDIRNVVRVIYGDSANRDPTGAPKRSTREVSDSASVAKYGRRFMEIAEDEASNIDTAAEADRMANAALSDLREPLIGTSYTFPCDFFLELGDRITLPADSLRFTAAQTLAVSSINHRFSGEDAETEVTLSGRPASQRGGWLAVDGRVNHQDVHQVAQLNSVGSTLSTAAVVGGQKFTVKDTGGKIKGALRQGYELHVSATQGEPPSAVTMQASGDGDTFVVADLVPGKKYFWKTVPRSTNTDRIVLGEPSIEQSFFAGRASAGHLDSMVIAGRGPPNGKFQTALDDLATNPPDHWSLLTGTWAEGGDVWHATSATNGRHVSFRGTAANPVFRSGAWPISRGTTVAKLFATVRPAGTLSAGRGLFFQVEFFADEALTNQTGSADAVAPWNIAAANVWADFAADLAVPAGSNFARVRVYKETASSAYLFDLAGVYFEPSVPLAAGFELPSLGGVTHVRATRFTAQAIPSGAETLMIFPTEVYDSLGEYNPATGIFTALVGGYYRVSASMLYNSSSWTAGTLCQIALHRNGTVVSQGSRPLMETAITQFFGASINDTVLLTAGQTLEIRLYHTRGASTDTIGDSAWNYLVIDRLL